jgi:hypothetical protein
MCQDYLSGVTEYQLAAQSGYSMSTICRYLLPVRTPSVRGRHRTTDARLPAVQAPASPAYLKAVVEAAYAAFLTDPSYATAIATAATDILRVRDLPGQDTRPPSAC